MSNERIPSPDAYLCLPLPVSAYVRLCLPVSVFLSLPMPVYACLGLSSCLCLCLSLLACVYIFLSLCLFHFLSLVRCTRTRTTPISHTHSFLTIFLLLSVLYCPLAPTLSLSYNPLLKNKDIFLNSCIGSQIENSFLYAICCNHE